MLQTVRGTHDLLPEEALKHRYILDRALEVCSLYGFKEIATPIFEFTEVFKRTLGDASDIVNKEMYTFEDRSGDHLTLRPEGTASVARMFISEKLSRSLPLKYLYHGPMFRHERPQKGRQRQFHQIGVEALGISSPLIDVEVISMAFAWLQDLGLKNIELEINSIGDKESRNQFRKKLVDYLESHRHDLSEESQNRLKTNPLRILDSKNPEDQKIMAGAPQLIDSFNNESKEIYSEVLEGLQSLNINFTENPRLVRGLDYYGHTVFEFTTNDLGAQNAVLSGGRYDQLVETMGGPATAGMGWAAGIERLALLLNKNIEVLRPVVFAPLGKEAEALALKLSLDFRKKGMPVEMTYSGNFKKRLNRANKLNGKLAVIIGEDELNSQSVIIKNLDTGDQSNVSISESTEQAFSEWKDLS